MTTKLAARMKELRKSRKLTQEAMGELLGVSKQFIGQIELGKKEPGKDLVRAICDEFNVSREYLEGESDIPQKVDLTGIYNLGVSEGEKKWVSLKQVPVYSSISCGTGAWINEEPEMQLAIPMEFAGSGEYFANAAEGDSMAPRIHSGDYLIFEKTDVIESGKIGSFALNDVYYCKRFKVYPDGSAWLLSDNPDYDPIRISETDDFRVLGLYRYKLSKEQ